MWQSSNAKYIKQQRDVLWYIIVRLEVVSITELVKLYWFHGHHQGLRFLPFSQGPYAEDRSKFLLRSQDACPSSKCHMPPMRNHSFLNITVRKTFPRRFYNSLATLQSCLIVQNHNTCQDLRLLLMETAHPDWLRQILIYLLKLGVWLELLNPWIIESTVVL